VFTEPQFNPGMVKNVFADTTVSTIGVMDPLGAGIVIGSGHYPALIQAMVNSVSEYK
jgi:zinc transport system substrate-binding protein